MHLFTHVRAKVALLFAGAFLWGAQAYADDLGTPDGYRELKTYDFTSAPLSTATLDKGTSAGYMYNAGNSCYNAVYATTAEGYENFVFQAIDSSKGWLASTGGLKMGPDAGRVAGMTGLKADQIVDIYYTGGALYTGDHYSYPDLKNSGSDPCGKKDTLAQESGCSRFQMLEDGAIAFELKKSSSSYVTKIVVWEPDEGVAVPTISYTGNSYATRLVTISGSGTIYYTITTGETTGEETLYENPISLTQTSTITAWVVSGEDKSDETSLSVTAGEVPAPTISAATIGNEITVSSSISDAKIYYRIGSGNEVYYESPFTLTEDAEVSAWVVYEEDENTSFTSPVNTIQAVVVSGSLQSDLNLYKAAWPDVTADKTEPTYSDVLFTVDGTSFVAATILTKQVNGLYVQSGTSWLKRTTSGNGGFYSFNDKAVKVAIPNVKEGQLVEVTGCTGLNAFTMEAVTNGELDELRSVAGSKYVFRCTGDGNLILSLNLYCYILEVKIYGSEPISITSTLNSATNAGTFYWSRTVGIPEGVQAFAGTLNDDNTEFTLAELSDYIPANTPVILYAPGKESVEFTAVDDIVAVVENSLKGQLESVTTASVAGDDNTVWVISSQADGSDWGFYKYKGENIVANRAYLVLPTAEGDAATAPAVRFPTDWNGTLGNVTSIERISTDVESVKAIFDLQGRRVESANRPGLYIVGGKKMLVK
jgi:hypothetical protein